MEALAIEGYLSGALSHHQASHMLGMGRFEFEGFLKDRQIFDHAYDVEDLDRDIETLRQFRDKVPDATPSANKGRILDALRRSPLVGADLEIPDRPLING